MFKTKLQKKPSFFDRCADFLSASFGTVWFLAINATVFFGWILLNSGLISGVQTFDHYPYGLLTTAVSLEAIFLSIVVLITQNRASQIAELREELDLEVNIRSENEVNKVLNMLDEIHKHLGMATKKDPELQKMKEKTNINDIENALIRMKKNK